MYWNVIVTSIQLCALAFLVWGFYRLWHDTRLLHFNANLLRNALNSHTTKLLEIETWQIATDGRITNLENKGV